MNKIIIIISLNVIIIGSAGLPLTYATITDDIGVQLSKTCVVMVKSNITSNCPTYSEIILLFPDNSDHRVSGQFVFEDGYLKRGPSPVEEEYRYYDQEKKLRVFIDPAADVANRVKLIVIQPFLDEYPIQNQKINSSSIDLGTIRFVNESCNRVTLSAINWQFTMGDTMMYLKNNCDERFTNLETIKQRTWERTIHDITTSYKYQLDKWFKESIERCGKRLCLYE